MRLESSRRAAKLPFLFFLLIAIIQYPATYAVAMATQNIIFVLISQLTGTQ